MVFYGRRKCPTIYIPCNCSATAVSASVQIMVWQKRKLPCFVPLGVLLPKLFKKNPKQLTNIASSMLFFTPNSLFSRYQLLHMQSILWHSLPIHCSTAKWGCFIIAISTARISQDFKKEWTEAAATNLGRWNYKYFALCTMHTYWSKVILRWERGKAKILLPAACRGLGKALTCLWS